MGYELWQSKVRTWMSDVAMTLREERAQGTTEYAILVGVLVVIAVIAIIAFRDRVGELWDDIAAAINSL